MPIINMSDFNPSNVVCSREAFIEAIQNGDEQFLKDNDYLSSYYDLLDKENNSVLHLAVESGNEILVKKILDDGVEINVINSKKQTPLHVAAIKNNCPIILALLAGKADLNVQDIYGDTPLHKACSSYKNVESIKMLLEGGAKATIKNQAGLNPLVELLPTNLKDSKQEFDQLCTAMKLLLRHGGKDNNFRYEFGFNYFVSHADAEHVEVLISAGAYIESRCHKHTPLLRAASLGKTATVELLLKRGADINATTTDSGASALHLAVNYGHTDTVKVLLVRGADPNKRKRSFKSKMATKLYVVISDFTCSPGKKSP